MQVSEMRDKLKYKCKYSGPIWQDKVNNMHDDQVIAVYHKLLSNGSFEKRKKRGGKNCENDYHQMTMFEYLEGLNGQVEGVNNKDS